MCLFMPKTYIVGNHMSRLIYVAASVTSVFDSISPHTQIIADFVIVLVVILYQLLKFDKFSGTIMNSLRG